MKYLSLLICFFILLSSDILLGEEAILPASQVGILETIKKVMESISQLAFALMMVATIVTRLIPGKKDDEKVKKIWKKVQKVLGYLPSIGVNPRTKELEKALEEIKKSDIK